MSYEISLFPRVPFSKAEFCTFFWRRENYELTDDGDLASYGHPDTGTSFWFEYVEATDGETGERPHGNHLKFEMNFFRPSVFGLEAVEHVSEVVKSFSCDVEDPQIDGMGDHWSAERFLKGWNKGNEFAFRAILKTELEEVQSREPHMRVSGALAQLDLLLAPDGDIEAVWRWNRERAALQAKVGAKQFVSRISWAALLDGDVSEVSPILIATWADPAILPEIATHVLVALDPPIPRGVDRLLRGVGLRGRASKMRWYLAPISDVREHVAKHVRDPALGALIIPHSPEVAPGAFRERLEAGWPDNNVQSCIRSFTCDEVLNAEILDRVLDDDL